MTIQYDKDHIDQVAAQIYEKYAPLTKIFTLTGPLGAGKTSLIKSLLACYGVQEPITSPTYAYMNVYSNVHDCLFYHFDLYRLDTIQDFIDAGFDEYLNTDHSVVVVEWPEIIKPLLQHRITHLSLDYADQERVLCVEHLP